MAFTSSTPRNEEMPSMRRWSARATSSSKCMFGTRCPNYSGKCRQWYPCSQERNRGQDGVGRLNSRRRDLRTVPLHETEFRLLLEADGQKQTLKTRTGFSTAGVVHQEPWNPVLVFQALLQALCCRSSNFLDRRSHRSHTGRDEHRPKGNHRGSLARRNLSLPLMSAGWALTSPSNVKMIPCIFHGQSEEI